MAKLLVVLVVYRTEIGSTATFQSLKAQLSPATKLLVYDNSPRPQQPPDVNLRYVHDAQNGGVAAAYLAAAQFAQSEGIDWLLLLDQDTQVPADYIAVMLNEVAHVAADSRTVAIAPLIQCAGRWISPAVYRFGKLIPLREKGSRCSGEITAINTGLVVRTDFLNSIGDVPPPFWLDYFDHWLFARIHACNKRVLVATAVLNHSLSVCNYNDNVSETRYRNILTAELEFVQHFRPKIDSLFLLLRLTYRFVVQVFQVSNKNIAKLTFRAIRELITHSFESNASSYLRST